MKTKSLMLNVQSHRAREKLISTIGYLPDYYFRNFGGNGPHYGYCIYPSDYRHAKQIKGISKMRNTSNMLKCWKG